MLASMPDMPDNYRRVRPTKRCLSDLSVPIPDISLPLEELDTPVVNAAQALPDQKAAGGAQRVLSLSDRVWFKVKTSDNRGVVVELAPAEIPELPETFTLGHWWVCAAGKRQADSPQHDFYEGIKRECTRGGTVSSAHLLPQSWDWRRLDAEQALQWIRDLRRTVIHLIAMSLKCGHLAVAEFQQHRIKALVRAEDGNDAYLAIVAEGIPDARIFAAILDCVPGVSADDWQPEPSALAEMDPAPGEIIWSTILPPEVASRVLDLDGEDD